MGGTLSSSAGNIAYAEIDDRWSFPVQFQKPTEEVLFSGGSLLRRFSSPEVLFGESDGPDLMDDSGTRFYSRDECPGNYTDEGFFCALDGASGGGDHDIESDDIHMIGLAYDLINDNLNYIEDYFDFYTDSSPTCLIDTLSGGSSRYGKSMISESTSATVPRGFNAWGVRYMVLNWTYLKAFSNTWHQFEEYEGTTTCVALNLARTIVHETCHRCFRIGEELPYLLDYYFGRRFLRDNDIDESEDGFCCGDDPLVGGYDSADYDGWLEVTAEDNNYQLVGWENDEGADGSLERC